MSIVIPGLTLDDKVPGVYRETKYGQGKVSIGALPVRCLVTGNKLSTGTATADQDINQIFSEADADTLYGAGSEIARQCYAALAIPGVTLYGAPAAEATSGPVKATLTVTIAGTWTTSGTVVIFLCGKPYGVTAGAGDSVTTVAANLALAVNGDSHLPMTATSSSGVLTLTVRNNGVRGNSYICRKDLSVAPAGLTAVLAGGTPLTNGITPFSAGAGADSVANVLALLTSDTYDYQGWAQNDATNAALIKTQLESEAGPLVEHTEHAVFGAVGTLAAAVGLAQTTLNEQRATVVWLQNGESHPSFIAAQAASARSVTVAGNPNFNFDNYQLPTVAPQSQKADIALHSSLKSALNSGVMPLTTTSDGRVLIVRAIQTHSLNGASPDYRTLDWGDADVPDRISKEIGVRWGTFVASNPYVGPDPGASQPAAPPGMGTPTLWNAEVYDVLKLAEAQNWIAFVDSNLPLSEYDPVAKRLMTAAPSVTAPISHQLGVSVRQTAA